MDGRGQKKDEILQKAAEGICGQTFPGKKENKVLPLGSGYSCAGNYRVWLIRYAVYEKAGRYRENDRVLAISFGF